VAERRPVTVSVVTSTYQREGTLPRLYESLRRQSFRDFEWVVVDDGSSDGSGELIHRWAGEAEFPIVYHWQENRGMGIGRNRAIERASGEYCALIDSDDWYLPHALERMVATWEGIPAERRAGFANVEGLRVDAEGELVLDRYPADVFDSNYFELRALHGVEGDSIGMYRREVLSAHPFPEDLGWHVTPAITWNRIASRYETRFVNEIWAGTDYQPGGLSSHDTELRLRFRRAQLAYWSEYAAMPKRMTRKNRLRANANYVRYSLLCGVGPRRFLAGIPDRLWTPIAALPGVALFVRDRLRLRRNHPPAES
jgi:glycosyltransferase involved in cell wall biosynthesis